MKARLVKFGEIEVEGKRYTHDVVIDGGKVRKRKKGPSKQFREKFGHTPLSVEEEIPWGGKRLIVGTGAHGALPVMDEVLAEAKRRGIELTAGAYIGGLSLAGGGEEGPGVRHPSLHVLTADLGDRRSSLLMAIDAVEADLRSTKKMSDALSDDVSKNQQPD
jgi:hypothetical protein